MTTTHIPKDIPVYCYLNLHAATIYTTQTTNIYKIAKFHLK